MNPGAFWSDVQGTNTYVTLKLMSSFSACFPRHADTPLWDKAKETNKRNLQTPHTHTHTLERHSQSSRVTDWALKTQNKRQSPSLSVSFTQAGDDLHLGCSCPSKVSLRMTSPPRWRSRNSRRLKLTWISCRRWPPVPSTALGFYLPERQKEKREEERQR